MKFKFTGTFASLTRIDIINSQINYLMNLKDKWTKFFKMKFKFVGTFKSLTRIHSINL